MDTENERLLEYADLAEETGVLIGTIRMWKRRGHFPEPSVQVGNRPAWDESVIRPTIDRIHRTGSPRIDGRYVPAIEDDEN